MVALTILVYRYFLDNPFGSLLSFWLTVVADLQQLLYLVSNYLTCIVFFSAFWKWFSVNAFPWSCIARRRVGKYCSKQDPWSKRRRYPFIISMFRPLTLWLVSKDCKNIIGMIFSYYFSWLGALNTKRCDEEGSGILWGKKWYWGDPKATPSPSCGWRGHSKLSAVAAPL
jgi:hypothetical protein